MPCYWWRQKIYPTILIIIFFPITKTQWFSEGSKAQDFVKVVDQFWHFLIDCDLKRIQLAAILQAKNEKDWHCTEKKSFAAFYLISEFPHALTRISIKNHEWIQGGSDFLSIKNVKILPVPPLFELLTWIHCPCVCVIPFSSSKQIKWMPFEPLKAFYRLCQLPLVFFIISILP